MPTRQPNIVLILSDDQGWGDLGHTGNRNLATPRIDRLAASGAVSDAFCVQPLCAPTRAEILTGRYFPRTGVRGVTRRAEYMNLDEITIADIFRRAGYATGCFGKWHSGSAYPYHPNGRGFDEFLGYCCGHWSHYFDSTLEHNGEEFKARGYLPDVLTDHALGFIEANRANRFLCYLPLNTPHSPFQVPDRWFGKFCGAALEMRHRDPDKENLDVTRTVLAMCENIDWNVGRVLDKLIELGIERDTIVVYLSDNGPNGWRWNGGMRGCKSWTDEGGVRSPFSIAWPGSIRAGTRIAEVAGAIDILPTLMELAGIGPAESKPLDGLSLRPLLDGNADGWPRRGIYAHKADGKNTSLRTDRYRVGGDAGGLYDMRADIGQNDNLTTAQPQLHAQLMRQVDAWREEVTRGQFVDRPLPVGYAEFPRTYLAAQDSAPSGDITWSSIHPNASYLVNWHDIDDQVRWETDVRTAGLYEVTLMYTCREGDEGAELQAECRGQAVTAKVLEAFDPPLKDKEDRVKRDESYEKQFHPLKLGSIGLEKGKADFVLRALSKTGQNVIDLRAVRLRLLQ